jgi:hypothetical protein
MIQLLSAYHPYLRPYPSPLGLFVLKVIWASLHTEGLAFQAYSRHKILGIYNIPSYGTRDCLAMHNNGCRFSRPPLNANLELLHSP